MIKKIKEFATTKEPCKFIVELKISMKWITELFKYRKGFLRQNLSTNEELLLTRLKESDANGDFLYFLLRRSPIDTNEDEWRQIVQEIHNGLDSGLRKIKVNFKDIGYSFFLIFEYFFKKFKLQ